MEDKIDFWEIFWRCFFRMRSGIDFGAFFRGSNLEKSLKTIGFSMVFAIFKKSTFSKKYRKNMDFGVDFGGQNHEKSRKNGVENHVFF